MSDIHAFSFVMTNMSVEDRGEHMQYEDCFVINKEF